MFGLECLGEVFLEGEGFFVVFEEDVDGAGWHLFF